MERMKVSLCGIEIDNPVIPASGTFGFGYEFAFANETKLVIDYALELPMQVEESYGSHFIAISFRF